MRMKRRRKATAKPMSEDVPSRPEASGETAPKPEAADEADLSVLLIWHAYPPKDWAFADERLEEAARAAFQAGSSGDPSQSYEVAIVFDDDAALQALNRDFRGKDKPTNVLSFPADPTSVGAPFEEAQSLGDVILSLDTLGREAKALEIPPQDHATHLVVHGVLHLLGFDHMDETQATEMEALETEILGTLGIADPYGETETPRLELQNE